MVGTVSCYNETVGCQTHVYNSSLARHPVQAHWDGAQTHNLFYTFSSLSLPFVFPPSSLYVKTVTWTGSVGGDGQDIAHMPRISLWIQRGHLVSVSPRRPHSPQCSVGLHGQSAPPSVKQDTGSSFSVDHME